MRLILLMAAAGFAALIATFSFSQSQACTDSDDGINESVKGICFSSDRALSDRCAGRFLLEGFCMKADTCGMKTINCNNFCKIQDASTSGICSNGVCTCSPIALPICSDTDNGDDPFISGTCSVTKSGKTAGYRDKCVSQRFLMERACSSGNSFCSARFFDCDAECKKGGQNSTGICSSNVCSCFSLSQEPKIVISEAYYDPPDETEEFVELFVENAGSAPLNVSGWKVIDFDGNNITLPFISGLGKSDYIVIYTGNGTDDLDASDGNASVYVRRQSGIWNNDGDEAGLYDNLGKIHDFMRYEGGSGDPVLANWPSTDNGPAAAEGESVQLNGTDMDSGANWISALPTPGGPVS